MAMEFRVEIIRKEIIKPSSPTPSSLKNFKLSLLDQLSPSMYMPVILCYTDDNEAADHFAKAEARSRVLKKSLSETLTRFYPFAGRISSRSFIECNDDGVDFIETRVDCLLQHILQQPDTESLRKLLPLQTEAASRGKILLVQLNFFKCGGMVIGLRHSHKIIDFSTLNLFIKTWAAMSSKGSYEGALSPDFETITSLFPPPDSLPHIKTEFPRKRVVSRRLVFDAKSVSMLKAQAACADVPRPTRVEAVVALIWKCAKAAATLNRGGLQKPSVLLQTVNLRKEMNPPLPENSTGNLVTFMIAHSSDRETELHILVKQFRSGIRGLRENFVRKLEGSNAVSAIFENRKEFGKCFARGESSIDLYVCTSLCGFKVCKAVDFGWGKSKWVCYHSMIEPVLGFELFDAVDGDGIEAWVSLSKADMAFFERNQQLLAFASVNPISKL